MQRKTEYLPDSTPQLEQMRRDNLKQVEKIDEKLSMKHRAKTGIPLYLILLIVLFVVIIVGGVVFYIYGSPHFPHPNPSNALQT